MKKIQLFLAAVMLSLTLNAAIQVTENGITKTYASKAVISDRYDSVINHNGVEIFVPKGSKVELEIVSENGQDVLHIKGDDFKDVLIGGKAVSADGYGVIAIGANAEQVAVISGEINVAEATAEQVQAKADAVSAQVSADATDVGIITVVTSESSYQQAASDAVLSPSAPR